MDRALEGLLVFIRRSDRSLFFYSIYYLNRFVNINLIKHPAFWAFYLNPDLTLSPEQEAITFFTANFRHLANLYQYFIKPAFSNAEKIPWTNGVINL